jgi:NhaA family Na+:H+ antiporter
VQQNGARRQPALDTVADFVRHEAFAGMLLVAAAALALVIANSGWAVHYELLIATRIGVHVGSVLTIDKPLLLWINDGLMAVFFLLVGLEIKRELVEGELASFRRAALPAAAAVGGMAVPAAIYAAFNLANPVALAGWAIPSATDIAFALGVLALLGPRVPFSLKMFLLAIAVLDDLGAILIIAAFYSGDLSLASLLGATGVLLAMVVLNLAGVQKTSPYILLGVLVWILVLKSGVHATLAGVAVALTIPLRARAERSPLRELEDSLHPSVAYAILPLFAFANAGVPLAGTDLSTLAEPVTLGIAAGLIVGKQIGVVLATVLAVRLRLAPLPAATDWLQIWGAALLCGIGFTMSLFIGTLAFPDARYDAQVRIGVLGGSLVSALAGYTVLRLSERRTRAAAPVTAAAR